MDNVIFQSLKLPHYGKFFVGGIKAEVLAESEILTQQGFQNTQYFEGFKENV